MASAAAVDDAAGTLRTPPRTRRERQRLRTRERLYQLAVAEFRRVGVARARVRDIVDAAGVVPGTFYFHFPTRDHVLLELFRRNAARVVARLPHGATGVPRFLRALGDAMIDVEVEVADPLLVRASVAVALRPPPGIVAAPDPIEAALRARLEQAHARGRLPGELAPAELVRVLLMSITGVLAVAPDDAPARRRELRRTIDFLLRALDPAPARSA